MKMPPAPNPSDFVFDTQAWSAASHVASLSCLTPGEGRQNKLKPENLPQNMREWDDSNPAIMRGKENSDGHSSNSPRGRQSFSLANLLRRTPRRKSVPRKRPGFESDDLQPVSTIIRSKSFVALRKEKHEDGPRSVSRNRRQEILGLVQASSSVSEAASSRSGGCCELHPQVRLRSNRCPRCAAGKRRRGSMGLDKALSTPDLSTAPECEIMSEMKKAEERRGSQGNLMDEIMENMFTDTAFMTDHADEDVSVEEVSLDPKWADALRGISMRLAVAREKEQETIGSASNRGSSSEEAEVKYAAPSTPPKMMDPPSTKANGRHSVDMEGGRDDDSISRSSLAWNAYVVPNTFAESKNQPLQPQGHYQPKADLSLGLQFFMAETKFEGARVSVHHDEASVCSGESSESDASSVTMSVASGYTLESYNSLAAPPLSSRAATARGLPRLNETCDSSPRTVINPRDLYSTHRGQDDASEEEDGQDFDNSFMASTHKCHSEKKMPTHMKPKTQEFDDATHHHRLSPKFSTAPENTDPLMHEQPASANKLFTQQQSSKTESQHFQEKEQMLVEDVSDDSDLEETPASPSTPSKSVASKGQWSDGVTNHCIPKPRSPVPDSSVSERPTMARENSLKSSTSEPVRQKSACTGETQPSFISALVHNSRARSCSRSRRSSSRSKSRPRNDAHRSKSRSRNKASRSEPQSRNQASRSKSRPRDGASRSKSRPRNTTQAGSARPRKTSSRVDRLNEPNSLSSHAPLEADQHMTSPKPKAKCQRSETHSPQPASRPVTERDPSKASHSFPAGARSPITHPLYKLGETARDEDMIIFPKKSRRSRSRRGRKGKKKHRSHSTASSSESDTDDEGYRCQVNIPVAIGLLSHLDAAFVRRSDGSWTYALVADGDENEIRFVVNDRGSTKSFPKALWKSSVRRVKMLTQRKGDRMSFTTKQSRKKRSICRSRSFRGRGKGRLVSPSPTRRNTNVLDLPPTIMENRIY